jgi:Tfp pilus assembly protein PilE
MPGPEWMWVVVVIAVLAAVVMAAFRVARRR